MRDDSSDETPSKNYTYKPLNLHITNEFRASSTDDVLEPLQLTDLIPRNKSPDPTTTP